MLRLLRCFGAFVLAVGLVCGNAFPSTQNNQANIWYMYTVNDQGATTASSPTVFYQNKTCHYSHYGYYPQQNCSATEMAAITIPVRPGYVYAGHYTEPNCGGTKFIQSDGSIIVDMGADTTVYACWAPAITQFTLNDQSATTHVAPVAIYLKTGVGWYSDSAGTNTITQLTTLPAKNGYDFGGFYTETGCSGEQIINANGNISSAETTLMYAFHLSHTLYACWVTHSINPNIYRVQLNPNNGESIVGSIYEKSGIGWYSDRDASEIISASIFDTVANGGAAIPQVTNGTDVFNGYWTTGGKEPVQIIDAQGYILVPPNTIGSSTTIEAHWDGATLQTSAVDFDLGDGTGTCASASVTATYGQPMPAPNCTVTPPAGYSFHGFYDYNGTGTEYYSAGLASVNEWDLLDANVTLVALYKPIAYTVTYKCDALTTGVEDLVRYDGAYDVYGLNDAGCSTPAGKVFDYWQSNLSGNVSFSAGQTIDPWRYATNVVLTAVFADAGYTITLNGSGATTQNTAALYTIADDGVYLDSGYQTKMDKTNNAITVPVRTYTVTYSPQSGTVNTNSSNTTASYTFDGYYSLASGGDQYIGSTGLITGNGIRAGMGYGSDATWYAQWSGTGTVTLPTPTRAGYTFNGWYTASSGGTRVGGAGDSYTLSANTELYAQWTASDYTLTLDNAGATTNGTATLYTTNGVAVYRDSAHTESMTTSANPITVPQRVYTVSYNAHDGTVNTTSTNTTATATFNGYYSASSGGDQYITSSGYITTAGLTAGKGYTDNNATWNAQWTNGSVTLPAPTRSGYVFNGWYTAASGGTLVGAAGASYTPTANVTLHAQWSQCAYTAGAHSTLSAASTNGSNQCTYTVTCGTGYSQSGGTNTTTSFAATGTAGVATGTLSGCSARTFTVSFDVNGGTGGQSADVIATYDAAMPSISTTAPTRTGYTFKGWYDNATWDAPGAIRYYRFTGESLHDWDKTSDATLYAGWQEKTYSINYTLNGGTNYAGAPESYTYGTGATVNGTPTRSNSTFVGWCTDSGLTSCSLSQTIGTTATGNKTFYAKWTCNSGYSANGNSCDANEIEINYADGGHGTAPSKGSCTYGATFSLASSLSATGYTFNGWGVNGNTHNGGATINCNSSVLGVSSGSVTVTGAWTPNTYTVSFNANNGTGGQSADVTATYDAAMPSISTTAPTRTGYTFKGWYDNATWNANGATQYYTAAGASAHNWDKTSATTLYAGWLANTYTVSFNANNGTGGQSADVSATYDAAMPSISTTAPTRTGYTFKGWYDNATWNASGATQYYTAAGASARSWDKTSATTLYAGWQANTYTVSYSCGDGTGTPPSTTTATYDYSFTPAANTCTRTGYGFAGWLVSDTNPAAIKGAGTAFTWNYAENKQLVAQWQAGDYVCASGTYLPANQTVCSSCIAGKYCTGGGYTFNSGADQGITGDIGPGRYSTGGASDADGEAAVAGGYYSTGGGTTATPTSTGNGCLTGFACGKLSAEYYSNGGGTTASPSGTGNGCLSGFVCGMCNVNYRDNSTTGKTSTSDCTANCSVGQCVHTAYAACSDAGSAYWASSGSVSYGSTSCNACPSGTFTSGSGYGANEASDCGRALHVGAYTLYLRSTKKTTPALHVKVNDETYYGNVHEKTSGVSGNVNIHYADKTYVICDETGTVCQGV